MTSPAVMVLGAGGFLGLNTVRAFLAAGIVPRCGRRPRGNVLGLRGLGVPLAVTDLTQPESLTEAMKGIDVVVHAAAHYPRFSHRAEETINRGLDELGAVLDAAVRAGVRRLVFVSSTATVAARRSGPSTEADAFDTCPSFGTYHALKWHLEQQLAQESRLEIVVACPAACLGPYDWKVGTSALLLATARGEPPPHPRGLISTVDARDVAAALVKLAVDPRPPPRLLLASHAAPAPQLLSMLALRYGRTPPPEPLSDDDARALADAEEVHAEQTGGRARLARELVDLIVHGPALDASLAERWGLNYRSLSETLDAWDAWALRMGLFQSPREFPSHDRRSAHSANLLHDVSTLNGASAGDSPGASPA